LISVLLATLFYGLLSWIALRRNYLLYFLFLILVAWAWRFASVLYIDEQGPIYAIELFRDIGGGHSGGTLLISYLIALGTICFVLRPAALAPALLRLPTTPSSAQTQALLRISNAVFYCGLAFLVILFLDMLRIGTIPVLAGLERHDYTRDLAGAFHRAFVEQGHILSFYLGLFYAARVHHRGSPDNRFLYLLIGSYVYLFLAGNRFSAYYANTSFFLMPWAAVALRRRMGVLPERGARLHARKLWVRIVQLTTVVAGVILVAFGLYRSYNFTRDLAPGLARAAFEHRIFVQQGELWVTSHERVFQQGRVDSRHAFNRLFVEPVGEPGRNTTAPFLMELDIGDAAFDVVATGTHYSGGYPEVLFELLGPLGGLLTIGIMAFILAQLLRILIHSILYERYLTVFFTFYVMYAFYLFHGSGMLNFLVNPKFWLKVSAFAAWLLFEAARTLPKHTPQAVPTSA
jgi:hypothetical protein